MGGFEQQEGTMDGSQRRAVSRGEVLLRALVHAGLPMLGLPASVGVLMAQHMVSRGCEGLSDACAHGTAHGKCLV